MRKNKTNVLEVGGPCPRCFEEIGGKFEDNGFGSLDCTKCETAFFDKDEFAAAVKRSEARAKKNGKR